MGGEDYPSSLFPSSFLTHDDYRLASDDLMNYEKDLT